MNEAEAKDAIAETIGTFTHDPEGFALFAYPWGEEGTDLAKASGPRQWQRETMRDIGAHLHDPETRHQPLRLAVASGHGIGKSACIAMIADWALSTCVDTRVVITANTEGQLDTKTSPEISKWFRMSINEDWFKRTVRSFSSTNPLNAATWRADLVTWSIHNTEAFAGLHNQGKRIVLIFDEASGIHEKVWEVALGALTDEDTEIIWIAFGNPTQGSGAFFECFKKNRSLWKTRNIDSRTVEGTNKKYLQEIVDTYGENSDIAKVRVRGMFPSTSTMQFIDLAMVEDAQERDLVPFLPSDPLIFGLDCARFGDDHSTLAVRRGRDARSIPWKRWENQDAMTLAADVVLYARQHHPDAIMVDAGNIGAAVIDRIRQLMPDMLVFEVWFGGKGRDAELEPMITMRTANKRAEMWTKMRHWLRGGCIPADPQLSDDLTGPQYGFSGDQAIQLERKQDMKKRGLASPDDGDALACTFAEPVQPRRTPAAIQHGINQGADDATSRYNEL